MSNPSITDALKAIKLRFDTSSAPTTGKLYGLGALEAGPKPKGTATGDYCAYYLVDDRAEYTFSDAFENIIIQFLVCTQTGSTAINKAQAIHELFDNWSTSFTSNNTITGGIVSMRRLGSTGLTPDPNGGFVWPVRYEVQIEKA